MLQLELWRGLDWYGPCSSMMGSFYYCPENEPCLENKFYNFSKCSYFWSDLFAFVIIYHKICYLCWFGSFMLGYYHSHTRFHLASSILALFLSYSTQPPTLPTVNACTFVWCLPCMNMWSFFYVRCTPIVPLFKKCVQCPTPPPSIYKVENLSSFAWTINLDQLVSLSLFYYITWSS